MAKKSLKRQIKESEERRSQKLLYRLDALMAAYTKATNIDPTQACLIMEELPIDEQVKTGKRMKYYFMHHEPKINDQTAHPDVKYLMLAAMHLTQARKQGDNESILGIVDEMAVFLKRYEDSDEATTESGQVVQNSVGAESGNS